MAKMNHAPNTPRIAAMTAKAAEAEEASVVIDVAEAVAAQAALLVVVQLLAVAAVAAPVPHVLLVIAPSRVANAVAEADRVVAMIVAVIAGVPLLMIARRSQAE